MSKKIKKAKVTVSEGYKIQLPMDLINEMLIKEGDTLELQCTPENPMDKCFVVQEDTEQAFNKEEYFCIPLRVMEQAGLQDHSLHIILGKGELTVTTTENIIESLSPAFILALDDQDIDFVALAEDVAERMNRYVLESDEMPV